MTLVHAQGLPALKRDIETSELCAYDYFKMILILALGNPTPRNLETFAKAFSKDFDAYCHGEMSERTSVWMRHRSHFQTLDDAHAAWSRREQEDQPTSQYSRELQMHGKILDI